MQKFSYHTHTNFSDGKYSIEKMLDKAVSLGWSAIGISDHMIIHKDIKKSPVYEMLISKNKANIYNDDFNNCLSSFQKHSDLIRKISKKYPIKVYIGYEVDYFTYDGWEEEFKDFIHKIDHDYLLNGNHFFFDEKCRTLIDIYRYDSIEIEDGIDDYETLLKRHYATIKKSIETGMFDILAHLDYVRRTKLHNLVNCEKERLLIIEGLKQSGKAMEISTKGLRKVGDFYPEDFLLISAIKNNIPLVISDDAHDISELGYEFEKAEEKLKELKCEKRFMLK